MAFSYSSISPLIHMPWTMEMKILLEELLNLRELELWTTVAIEKQNSKARRRKNEWSWVVVSQVRRST